MSMYDPRTHIVKRVTWSRVNEKGQYESQQTNQHKLNDEPLVVAPQHKCQTFEGLQEPHQGRVRTTENTRV